MEDIFQHVPLLNSQLVTLLGLSIAIQEIQPFTCKGENCD